MPIDFVKKRIVEPGADFFRERIADPVREFVSPRVETIIDRGKEIVSKFRKDEEPKQEEMSQAFSPEQIQTIRSEQEKVANFVERLRDGSKLQFSPLFNKLLENAKIKHESSPERNEIVIKENITPKAKRKLINEVGAETAERILQDIERIDAELRPEIEFRDPTVPLTIDEKQIEREKKLVGKWQFLDKNPNLSFTFQRAIGTMMDTDRVTELGLVREDIIKFNEVLGDENLRQRVEIETELLEGLGHIGGTQKVLTTLFRPVEYYFTEAPAYQTIEEVNLQKDLKNISDNAPEIEKLANNIFNQKFWNMPSSWSIKTIFSGEQLKQEIERLTKAWELNKKDIKRGNNNAEEQLKYLLHGQDLGIIEDKSNRMQGVLDGMDTINRLEKIRTPLDNLNNEFEKLLDAEGNVPEENIESWKNIIEKRRPLINQYNELIAEYNYITRHADDLNERYISTLNSMGVKHEVGMDGSIKITDKKFLDAIEPYTPYLRRIEELGVSSGKINFARRAGRITSVAAETAAFMALIALTKGVGKAALGIKSGVKLKIVGGEVARITSKKGLARVLTLQGLKQTARFVAPKALTGTVMGIRGYNEAMIEYAATGDIRSSIMMGVAGAATTYGVIKAFQVPSKVMRARELARWNQAAMDAKRATDNAVRQMWSGKPIIVGGRFVGREPAPFWKWGAKTVHFEVSDATRIKQMKNAFVTTQKLSEKQISRISVTSSSTKPIEFPRYKVIILENQITGARSFRVVPDIPRKVYANTVNFNYLMKNGKQFSVSTMGLSDKPLPAFESYDKFLRMTRGKKFFLLKQDPSISRDIYMAVEAKNVKMVNGRMELVPYKIKDVQYLMKQYGYNPEKGTFNVETRLTPKNWERVYREINEAYKAAPKVGKATVKTKFKQGDNVDRRVLNRIFEHNRDMLIIDDKGNVFIVNNQYSVFDKMTGKINYEYGLAVSQKEAVVTNLNKIQYWLQKHFDSFGVIPKSKLLKISNTNTFNTLKKYHEALSKGKPIVTQTIGEINKLDPVLKRQVLSASEYKVTGVLKPQELIKYNTLRDLIAPDVGMSPPYRTPTYTPVQTPPIDYLAGLTAKETLLKDTHGKLTNVQQTLRKETLTPQLQREIGRELQDTSRVLVQTDFTREAEVLSSRVRQVETTLKDEQQRKKQLLQLPTEQKDEYIKRMIEGLRNREKALQKQLQRLKQQQKQAMKLSKMFQDIDKFFNNINVKFQKKPIKDLPYFDFPRIRLPPRRVPKIVEGQGYIALWLEDKKWLAISPVMNRNGAVYEGFTTTLRNPKVRRFRVRRINYRRVAVIPGVDSPPNHLFKKVKINRMGKIPVEEEWIQRK